MVKNHMRCVGTLPWVWHGVTDRWRRWRPIVLLRRTHHVMWMAWIVSRMMVRRRGIARLGEHLTCGAGASGIIMDWNRDEVAVFPCGNR